MGKRKQWRRKKAKILIKSEIMKAVWICLAALFLLFIMENPALREMRDTVAFDILRRLAISLPFLWFGCMHSRRPPKAGRWTTVAAAGLAWISLLVYSRRVAIVYCTVILYAAIIVSVYYWMTYEQYYPVLLAAIFYSGLNEVSYVGTICFVENAFPFWIPALLLGIFISIICAWLLWSGKFRLKDDRLSERIAFVLGAFMVGFVVVWSTLCVVNDAMDASEPIQIRTALESKEINHSSKSTYYELYMYVEEKLVHFDVSESEYYDVTVGQQCLVERYEGFLGEPYYVLWEE